MSDTDDSKKTNVTEFSKAKKEKKDKKPVKVSHIFGWIILVLITVVLILGMLLPGIGLRGQNSLDFGSYNGEKIEFANGNFFADQYFNIASSIPEENREQSMFNIWDSAYKNTVIYTAINQMAEDAHIKATDEAVNKAIIASGLYNNEEGVFDSEKYNSTPQGNREMAASRVRRDYPYSVVANDLSTVLTSNNETAFVAAMAGNTKSFEYITVDSSLYPDELAVEYAENNSKAFLQIDVDMVSSANEEDIKAARDMLANGTDFAELENFKEVGNVSYYILEQTFAEAADAEVFVTAEDGYVTEILKTTNGYAMFRVNKAAEKIDMTKAENLLHVKQYISNFETEAMSEYLDSAAAEIAAAAKADFGKAAEEKGLEITTVADSAINVSGSQYLNSIAYSDPKGVLASISTDKDKMNTLYSLGVNEVSDPIRTNYGYVIARATAETAEDPAADYIEMVYPIYAASHNLNDTANLILSSDKLDNKFFEVLFNEILAY